MTATMHAQVIAIRFGLKKMPRPPQNGMPQNVIVIRESNQAWTATTKQHCDLKRGIDYCKIQRSIPGRLLTLDTQRQDALRADSPVKNDTTTL